MRRQRFFRYAVVGILAFLIDLMVTLALLPATPHYLLANTVGFIAANLVQFVLAHKFVFGHKLNGKFLFSAYLATLVISAMGLALSNALVFVGVEVIGMVIVLSKAVTAVIVLAFNYIARVATVYRAKKV